jgi:hypothetical protein
MEGVNAGRRLRVVCCVGRRSGPTSGVTIDRPKPTISESLPRASFKTYNGRLSVRARIRADAKGNPTACSECPICRRDVPTPPFSRMLEDWYADEAPTNSGSSTISTTRERSKATC